MSEVQKCVPLRPYTTLRAGGAAQELVVCRTVDDLAQQALEHQTGNRQLTILGWGSNVLPSDAGVSHRVAINASGRVAISEAGDVEADSGCGFQELFLKCAQAGLGGLEFAVGIPGSLAGALVSNAGAYRHNVSEHLTGIEVVYEGRRTWAPPSLLEFSYRDSLLRRPNPPACAILRVRFKLPRRDAKAIYDDARDHQRQRISKQPPPASAGSFFKNVEDKAFARSLPGLPQNLKDAGVVPSGYLLEAAGMKGFRVGGAKLSERHANFILNIGRATATEIRTLAHVAKRRVHDQFGVDLEEEVLYLGDWSAFRPIVG